jgi:hypothetical protein
MTLDYTTPKKVFRVSTAVTRNGVAYMGPDIKVNARDAQHAEEVAKSLGHEPNRYFPPREVEGA